MTNVVDFPEKGKDNKGGERKRRPRKERPVDLSGFEELLQNFVLIYGTDCVYDIPNRLMMKIAALRLAKGQDPVKAWLASPSRKTIMPDQLVFDPTGEAKPPLVNMFDRLPLDPSPGPTTHISALLLHLVNGRMDIFEWIERWVAYPLRHPGAKMRTAVLMHGDEGSGKNLYWDTIQSYYGRYGVAIGQPQIEAKFNDWMSCKLFVVADEVVTKAELSHVKGRLRQYITSPAVMIEPKSQPVRSESNHMNMVFLSNETQPLVLEEGDRRYLVVMTPLPMDDLYYREVRAGLAAGEREAYLHYLLHELDMGSFSEHTKPPLTADKEALIGLGVSPARRFVADWLAGSLPIPFGTTTTAVLYRAFSRWCDQNGEKWPPSAQRFIAEVERSLARHRIKAVKVRRRITEQDENGLGTERIQRAVLLIDGPPAGRDEADWIDECIGLFIGGMRRMGVQSGWKL